MEKLNLISAQYSAKLKSRFRHGFKDGWIDTRSYAGHIIGWMCSSGHNKIN